METVTAELDAIRDRAMALDQPSAAKGAVETKAKLHGLLVDRKESGAPGEFSQLQTREQVLALLRTELGEDVAALLAAKLASVDALPGDACDAALPTAQDIVN